MLILDHLAVGCTTLAEGVAWVEETLGVALGAGGQHAHYGTHNRLIGLAPDLYLEVIAKDPDAAPTGRSTWFGLDDFTGPPRLANWLCRTDELEAYAAIAGPAVSLSRGALRWETTVPDDGSLPMGGGYPSLIRWGAGVVPPGLSLPDSGCQLRQLTVTHPQASWLRAHVAVQDDLVAFEDGALALHAEIMTPHGARIL